MKKDTDRRIRYTKMVLKQSLLQLMRERDIGRITVKDICELADINRSTFYTHYSDPRDLLDTIEEELLLEMQKSVDRFTDAQNVPDMIIGLIRAIVTNNELCENILSSHGDKEFLKRAMDIPRHNCVAAWQRQFP
jgi:AcrR family transcriptional regulator